MQNEAKKNMVAWKKPTTVVAPPYEKKTSRALIEREEIAMEDSTILLLCWKKSTFIP